MINRKNLRFMVQELKKRKAIWFTPFFPLKIRQRQKGHQHSPSYLILQRLQPH